MIKLTAKKEVFLNLANAVLVMEKEASIIIDEAGLKCNIGGAGLTSAVFINIPKTQFDTFEVPSAVKFGLKIDEFKARINRCGKLITMEVDDKVKIISEDKNYGIALFEVKGFDKQPKFTFTSKITIPREKLASIVGDISVVTQVIKITTVNGKIEFSGHGELAADKITLSPEIKDVSGTDSSEYMLDILEKMVGSSDVETAYLELSTGTPLQLTLGNVVYYLGAKAVQS
jgi:hypothetical protein